MYALSQVLCICKDHDLSVYLIQLRHKEGVIELNFIQLVGRIVESPEKLVTNTNAKYSKMILSVTSNFLEFSGEYRHDLFPVRLWRGINQDVIGAFKEDRLVSIKGRVEVEDEKFVIVAEHLEVLFP